MDSNGKNRYDAIVIGSGIGGLTSAAILSKLNKKRVLVLEKHFQVGGLTHTFSRGKYRWEVGTHYVGMMKKGMMQRVLIDFITEKKITWLPIKSPFERLICQDITFGVSTKQKEHEAELIAKFPENRRSIRRYFRDVNRSAKWYVRRYLAGFLPQPLSYLLRIFNALTRRIPLMTTKAYLDTYIANDTLAAILAHRWGDYGATPEESSFAMHAIVMKHYSHGGFFPEGSSNRIAATIEKVIEKADGKVLCNRDVREIIIENNRATGVRVVHANGAGKKEELYHAPVIISNAGAHNTYRHLADVRSTKKLNEHIATLPAGHSAVSVYIGLKHSPKKLGVSGENIWINEHGRHDDVPTQTRELLKGDPKVCYVSFPSMRAGETSHHIAVIIAVVDYTAFDRWNHQTWRKKDDDYYEMKEGLARSLTALVERQIPGFSKLIDYREVSTPLTMEYFTNRERGPMYGFSPTPRFFKKQSFKVRTPVKGLYLSGTDVCSPGVTGAMMGGVATASVLNGYFGLIKVIASARMYARKPAKSITEAPSRKICPTFSSNM